MDIIASCTYTQHIDEEDMHKLLEHSEYIRGMSECSDFIGQVDLTHLTSDVDAVDMYLDLSCKDDHKLLLSHLEIEKIHDDYPYSDIYFNTYELAFKLSDDHVLDIMHNDMNKCIDNDQLLSDGTTLFSEDLAVNLGCSDLDIILIFNMLRNVPFLCYLVCCRFIQLHDCFQDDFLTKYERGYYMHNYAPRGWEDDFIDKLTDCKTVVYPYNDRFPKDIIEICNFKYKHMSWAFYKYYRFEGSFEVLLEDESDIDRRSHLLVDMFDSLNRMKERSSSYYLVSPTIPYPRHNYMIMQKMQTILDKYSDDVVEPPTGTTGPTEPIGHGVEKRYCQILSCPTNKLYRMSVLKEAQKISELTCEELDYSNILCHTP